MQLIQQTLKYLLSIIQWTWYAMDMRDAERNEVVMKLENVGMASDGPMIGTLL
jgi:hypothetical protein